MKDLSFVALRCGGALEELEEGLVKLREDCEARPHIKDARKLVVTVSMEPSAQADDYGRIELVGAKITTHVVPVLPTVKRVVAALAVDGAIRLNEVTAPESEASARQLDVVDFEAEAEKRKSSG